GVGHGDADAGAAGGVAGEEALAVGFAPAVEDADVRTAAGACARDDVGLAVAVQVADCHVDAAAEAGVVGKEAADRLAGLAKDAHLRAAARACAGDDHRAGGAVDVAHCDVDAAAEVFVVGKEAGAEGLAVAVEDAHLRAAAGTGAGDDFRLAVVVQVADGQVDGALVGVAVRGEGDAQRVVGVVHGHAAV